MKRQELLVAALESGTVIDHIPSSKLFEVVNLLHLEQMKTSITVGYNLKSKKMGHKSIIKIAGKFFSDEELNQLAVVSPNVTLCIIKDYEVLEKGSRFARRTERYREVCQSQVHYEQRTYENIFSCRTGQGRCASLPLL